MGSSWPLRQRAHAGWLLSTRKAGTLAVPARFAGCLATRGPLRGSEATLKRQRFMRGSDIRELCSCFRLFAYPDRWRLDHRVYVRLRLGGRAVSSLGSLGDAHTNRRQERGRWQRCNRYRSTTREGLIAGRRRSGP